MNRQDIIAMAAIGGMTAYATLPAKNAIGNSVPVEWLEKFAALVVAFDRQSLAANVDLPESRYTTTGDIKDINEFTRAQLRDYGDRRAAAEREAIALEFDRRAAYPDGTPSGGWYEPDEPAEIVRARGAP